MIGFYQSVKTKRRWILIFCSLVCLSCVAIEMIELNFSKPYTFNVVESLKTGRARVSKETQSRDIFLGRRNASNVHELKRNVSQHFNLSTNSDRNESGLNSSSNIKVGILIPSSTRRIKQPVLENLTLTTICIPSIYKTIELQYIYVIYIGIDKGDYLESVKYKLKKMFDNVKTIVARSRSFTKVVNAIAREAYQDGMDYLVRINDDSSFESQNWTSKGISILQNYSPPNVGVVGPTCHQGNTGILTHDMVHHTHLEIFDFYYPPYFDNWWADDWMTEVYKPNRSTKLPSWLVKHHLLSHGTRYSVEGKQHSRLKKILTFDKERLTKYLSTDIH